MYYSQHTLQLKYRYLQFTRMKLAIFLALLLIFSVNAADDEVYNGPSQEDVVVVDKDTLQPTIYSSDQTWLLELYAPWCGHCKTLRPEWAKLATQLKGIAKVAKIDASVNRQFDKTYDLKGYPHIVLIPAGPKDMKIYYKYDGARTANAMAEWAQQQIKVNKGFLVERLTSQSKWKSNCQDLSIPLCVVVFLPNILDSSQEERAVYLQMVRGVVNNFRDKPVSFMWAQAGDHQQLQDIFSLNAGFPSVILINPMRRLFSIMRSSFSQSNLQQWLKDILNRKGGRKFGQYHKSLVFNTVEDSGQAETAGSGSDNIEIGESQQEFAEEL